MNRRALLLTLAFGLVAAYAGRLAWRAHKNIVTLDVHNMPVRDVVRKIRWQTWESVTVHKDLTNRVSLTVEGLAKGELVTGKHVAVIEDVTTTGGSSLKAVAVLREAGATVRTVLTLLDREEGAEPAFAAAGVRLLSLLKASDFRAGGGHKT